MFIQTEPTPNPNTLKFLPGRAVMEAGTAEFADPGAAKDSPLAERLFEIDGVSGVFYGADFISVTTDGSADWMVLKPQILAVIMDHFTAGGPLLAADREVASASGNDSALVVQIKEILDTRVRPSVANDGGDIIFRGFEDGIVYLQMQWACSGCPSSTATLKHGIENMLKYYVPEVREVQAV